MRIKKKSKIQVYWKSNFIRLSSIKLFSMSKDEEYLNCSKCEEKTVHVQVFSNSSMYKCSDCGNKRSYSSGASSVGRGGGGGGRP